MIKKLVIFDLDGVLVDACDWHKEALNGALREVCDYEIGEVEHNETFNGIPTRVKLKILSEMGIVDKKDHKLINDLKQKETIKLIETKATPQKDKVELIEHILEKDYFLACYTNSIKETAFLMLHKSGILNKFHYVLTNEDVSRPKPHSEGYNFLMRYFDVEPKNCFIIEDSPKGLEAAFGSGATVIAVKNPSEVNVKNLARWL